MEIGEQMFDYQHEEIMSKLNFTIDLLIEMLAELRRIANET